METTLAERPHNLVTVATRPFLVVAADTHIVTIRCPGNSVEKIFRNRVVKTTTHHPDPIPKSPRPLNNCSRSLDIPTRRQSRTPASHGSNLKQRVHATRLPILMPLLTNRPRHYMMYNIIVL